VNQNLGQWALMEKKKKLIIGIVLIIILVPIIGLGIYLGSIKKPEVKIEDIRFKSFNIEAPSITFIVTVDVYNPNDISATLKYLDVNVFIDYEFVGIVRQDINKEIKAKEHTKLDLDFVLYDVPIITSQVVDVMVRGHASVTVSLLSFNIPIDETKEVQIGGGENNNPPIAIIPHDAGLVQRTGVPITFDATSSYDSDGWIASVEWDFGDGSPIEIESIVQHAYESTGRFTITLTVYDNFNATGTDVEVIAVVGL